MAYDLERLKAGIIAADKAGDTASVQALGAEYRKIQSQPEVAPEKPAAPSPMATEQAKLASGQPSDMAQFIPGAPPQPKPQVDHSLKASDILPNQDKLNRAAGLSARSILEGGVSPVTGTLDAVTMAANHFMPKGYEMHPPSELFSQGLTRLGVPEPRTPTERTVNTIGNFAGGAMAPTGIPERVGQMAAPAVRAYSEGMMRNALNPIYKANLKGDADVAVNTMLDQDIPLSRKGTDRLQDAISELNKKVVNAISSSKETVKVSDLESAFNQSLQNTKGMPKSDLDLIKRELQQFKTHPLVAGKSEIPVQDAQILKQGFQQSVADRYGQPGTGVDKAQKAIAHALREQVGTKVPDVIPWNKEEQKLIRTLNVAQRRLIMEGNRNPMGLAGLEIANPKTFAAMMLDKNSVFKSFLARLLNKAKETAPSTSARAAQGAAGAIIPPGYQQSQPPTGQ